MAFTMRIGVPPPFVSAFLEKDAASQGLCPNCGPGSSCGGGGVPVLSSREPAAKRTTSASTTMTAIPTSSFPRSTSGRHPFRRQHRGHASRVHANLVKHCGQWIFIAIVTMGIGAAPPFVSAILQKCAAAPEDSRPRLLQTGRRHCLP